MSVDERDGCFPSSYTRRMFFYGNMVALSLQRKAPAEKKIRLTLTVWLTKQIQASTFQVLSSLNFMTRSPSVYFKKHITHFVAVPLHLVSKIPHLLKVPPQTRSLQPNAAVPHSNLLAPPSDTPKPRHTFPLCSTSSSEEASYISPQGDASTLAGPNPDSTTENFGVHDPLPPKGAPYTSPHGDASTLAGPSLGFTTESFGVHDPLPKCKPGRAFRQDQV